MKNTRYKCPECGDIGGYIDGGLGYCDYGHYFSIDDAECVDLNEEYIEEIIQVKNDMIRELQDEIKLLRQTIIEIRNYKDPF